MVDPTLESFLADMLHPLGGVVFRRMFGGSGLYRDGLMFGLVIDGVLHFKADAETRPAYEAAGSTPFTYDTKTGRRTVTSYWRVPEALFDEPDQLVDWAREAAAVARRVDAAKAARTARPKRGAGGVSVPIEGTPAAPEGAEQPRRPARRRGRPGA